MQTEDTLILSDLHLGRPGFGIASAEGLRPLWRDVCRVIFNGDTAEVHHPRHRAVAARETIRLLDLCEQDGVEPVLLSGNHDPYVSDVRHLELANRQVFITHGDVFHPAIAPWSPRAGRMRAAHRAAMQAMRHDGGVNGRPRLGVEEQLRVAQHASHAEWDELATEALHSTVRAMLTRPWAVMQVLWYWNAFPNLAARFAVEHELPARFLITGHTHHPGAWETAGRTIINTGSFGFPGRPLAVRIGRQALTVHRVIRHGARFVLEESPRRIYSLRPTSEDRPRPMAADTREVRSRLSAEAMRVPASIRASRRTPVVTPIRSQ